MNIKTYVIFLFISKYLFMDSDAISNNYVKEQQAELNKQIEKINQLNKNLNLKIIQNNKTLLEKLANDTKQFKKNEDIIIKEVSLVFKNDLLERLNKKKLMKSFYDKVEIYVNSQNKEKRVKLKNELNVEINNIVIGIFNSNYLVVLNNLFKSHGISNPGNQNQLIFNDILNIVKDKIEKKEKESMKKNTASQELTFLTKKFCNKKNKYDNTVCNMNVFKFVLEGVNEKMVKSNYFKFKSKARFQKKLTDALKLEFKRIHQLKNEFNLFQKDKITKKNKIKNQIEDLNNKIKDLKAKLK